MWRPLHPREIATISSILADTSGIEAEMAQTKSTKPLLRALKALSVKLHRKLVSPKGGGGVSQVLVWPREVMLQLS